MSLGAVAAKAQSDESAATETEFLSEPEKLVDDDGDELTQLRSLYTLQIESYRQAEKEQIIAKEQYKSLETLKLLEQAVLASQKAMVERNRVLLTYFDLLYLHLQYTPGINLQYKEPLLEDLKAQTEELRAFQAKVEATDDRDGIAARAEEFSEIVPRIESNAYRTLTLLAIGKLQTVHDKGILILNDVKAAEAESDRSTIQKAQIQRAFDQTQKNLEDINTQLREQNDYYARQEDKPVKRTFYTQTLDRLKPVYVELSQLLAHLKELLTI